MSDGNGHYAEYSRLLRKLHLLMREGKGNAGVADAVRDEMDTHWDGLTPEEQATARELSVDLYTLEKESPIEHPTRAGIYSDSLQSAVAGSWERGDWLGVLRLLRESPAEISRGLAATLRGRCYEKLGDPETAALFHEEAASLDSEEATG